MANIDFPALVGAYVIDSSNNTLYLDEGGSTFAATIAAGTYFLRGDGSSTDLLKAIQDALDAAGPTNSYNVKTVFTIGGSSSWNRDKDDHTLYVTVGRVVGGATFRVRWNHGSTTFPKSVVGFVSEKGAADGAEERSTTGIPYVWAGTGHIEDAPPRPRFAVVETALENGDTDILRTASLSSRRAVSSPMCASERIYEERAKLGAYVGGVAFAALESFARYVMDGRPVEFHKLTLVSGALYLANPSSSTLVGTYRLGESVADALESAPRSQTGLEQFDLEFDLAGYVAP